MKMNCTSLTLVYSTYYCDVNVTKMYYAAMEDVIAIQKVNSTDNPDEWFCTTDNESLFLDKKYVYDTYCKNSQNLYINVKNTMKFIYYTTLSVTFRRGSHSLF